MLLKGHQCPIYTMKCNPAGTVIARFWRVYGDCKNFMVLKGDKGHKNAILDLHWTSYVSQIVSASPDKTVRAWDVETGKQVKKMAELVCEFLSVLLVEGSLLTNSMDCTLCVCDIRPYAPQNQCVKIFEGHQHNFEKNLLTCAWSPDGSKVTAGSADRMVSV